MIPFIPNEGKKLNITTADFGTFSRYPVRTHIVMKGDSLPDMMDKYVMEYLEPGDMIFISEKIVAISQGRAFPIKDIKTTRMAKFLVRFVYKSPYGIGLGSPWTMQLAINEIGIVRILFAAGLSAVTKLFGIRGVFYRILGDRARAIDGPCEYTLPPYNEYAKLAPDKPNEVAAALQEKTGCPVVVIDANDLGVEILGRSSKDVDIHMCKQIFKDNPLDQTDQQTPIAIIRKVVDKAEEALDSEEKAETFEVID